MIGILRAGIFSDAIVMGPGSLYTSVLANLLIENLSAAIARAQAPKIYICNVMTQPHETDRCTAFDHVNAIAEHARPDVLSHVIVNNGPIPAATLARYARMGSAPVTPDTDRIRALGYQVIEDNIVNTVDMVRHNPRRVSKLILEILSADRKKGAAERKRRKNLFAQAA